MSGLWGFSRVLEDLAPSLVRGEEALRLNATVPAVHDNRVGVPAV
jgi:hypothetical protein